MRRKRRKNNNRRIRMAMRKRNITNHKTMKTNLMGMLSTKLFLNLMEMPIIHLVIHLMIHQMKTIKILNINKKKSTKINQVKKTNKLINKTAQINNKNINKNNQPKSTIQSKQIQTEKIKIKEKCPNYAHQTP